MSNLNMNKFIIIHQSNHRGQLLCQFVSLSPSLSKAMVNMSMCVPMCGLNVDYVSGRGLELDKFVWVLYITHMSHGWLWWCHRGEKRAKWAWAGPGYTMWPLHRLRMVSLGQSFIHYSLCLYKLHLSRGNSFSILCLVVRHLTYINRFHLFSALLCHF